MDRQVEIATDTEAVRRDQSRSFSGCRGGRVTANAGHRRLDEGRDSVSDNLDEFVAKRRFACTFQVGIERDQIVLQGAHRFDQAIAKPESGLMSVLFLMAP